MVSVNIKSGNLKMVRVLAIESSLYFDPKNVRNFERLNSAEKYDDDH